MITEIREIQTNIYIQKIIIPSTHYPKIPNSLMREKGTEYFKGVDLTGSKIGTKKSQKISLLDVTKNAIIPKIEDKVVTRYDDEG